MKPFQSLAASCLVAIAVLAVHQPAWGDVGTLAPGSVVLGTGAPPATLGGYAMTGFNPDPTPAFDTSVGGVQSPTGGYLSFSTPMDHATIGQGWATWSNGYRGDVYANFASNSTVMSLPTGTRAFSFYAEPNNFATYSITATTSNGQSLTQNVNGFAGAAGYGFFTTGSNTLSSISVNANPAAGGFAVGEFAINAPHAPASNTLSVPAIPAYGAGSYVFDQSSGSYARNFSAVNPGETANYSFSGSAGGTPVSASWSPANNASNGFVPFLGNDANGHPVNTTVSSVPVAYITDGQGHQYGTVDASYNTASTGPNNTLFTFRNNSGVPIDPTIVGVSEGGTLAQNFGSNPITTSTTGVPAGGSVATGTPQTTSDGFTIPTVNYVQPSGLTGGIQQTIQLTSDRNFTATSGSANVTITQSSGSVIIGGDGGTATVQLTGTISLAGGTRPTTLLTLPLYNPAHSYSTVGTTAFVNASASGVVSGLVTGSTYRLQTVWSVTWTPRDSTSTLTVDPGIGGSVDASPSVASVPEPSSLALLSCGAGLIGCGGWLRRRRAAK